MKEYIATFVPTIQRWSFVQEEWVTVEVLDETGDLDMVREAWRTYYRNDSDNYYRVWSPEGVWFGLGGNPVEHEAAQAQA